MKSIKLIEEDFKHSYNQLLNLHIEEKDSNFYICKPIVEPYRLHLAAIGDKFYVDFAPLDKQMMGQHEWKLCVVTYIRVDVVFFIKTDVETGYRELEEDYLTMDSYLNVTCKCFKEVADVHKGVEYINLCPYTKLNIID